MWQKQDLCCDNDNNNKLLFLFSRIMCDNMRNRSLAFHYHNADRFPAEASYLLPSFLPSFGDSFFQALSLLRTILWDNWTVTVYKNWFENLARSCPNSEPFPRSNWINVCRQDSRRWRRLSIAGRIRSLHSVRPSETTPWLCRLRLTRRSPKMFRSFSIWAIRCKVTRKCCSSIRYPSVYTLGLSQVLPKWLGESRDSIRGKSVLRGRNGSRFTAVHRQLPFPSFPVVKKCGN